MLDKQIADLRLRRQALAPVHCATPVDVVRHMGAMQGQDYHQSLWAIGVRTPSATLAQVEQSYAQREIVRGWPVRGTMHVVAGEDVGWMTAIAAERRIAADARRMRQLELTFSDIDFAGDLLTEALSAENLLKRPAINALWQQHGIATAGQRGYHILWHLAQRGLICIGPTIQKQQSFALLREWIPTHRALAGDEALGELVARFFSSRGPATANDFATWAGLTLADTKIGLHIAGRGVERWRHDTVEYWIGIETSGPSSNATATLLLLPGFDEFLLGYRDRSAVLAAENANRVVPGGNGIFKPFVVVEGEVVATWQRIVHRQESMITLVPFPGHSVNEAALQTAKERYARFLGMSPT